MSLIVVLGALAGMMIALVIWTAFAVKRIEATLGRLVRELGIDLTHGLTDEDP